MRFLYQLSQQDDLWIAEHTSSNAGPIRVTAPTQQAALDKLEAEIRYWLELCPCSGEMYRETLIELVVANRSA